MLKIKTNSKNIVPGDTFVAIKGQTVDGHNYIESAIENGATTVICQNNKEYSVKTINVSDTKAYLEKYLIDNYADEVNKLKIVALTGTNGKTTTAYITYEILRKLKIKCAYLGTIGFYINDHQEEKTANTTPEILTMYNYLLKAKKSSCEIFILEASSIGLAEGRLKGIKFDAVCYTNLTHDHLDYHKTMHNYMEAKMIAFENLKSSGISIINIDDKYANNFITKKCITYGFNNADILCTSSDKAYKNFSYKYKNNEYSVSSSLFGKYNIFNTMASIGILIALGIDEQKINKYYAKINLPDGRINEIKYKTNTIIVDYAHTPDGMKQVLSAAQNLDTGKTYVVFGCPGNRDRKKRPLMTKMAQKYSDYFILTDDDPHNEDEMQIINDAIKGITANNYEVIVDRKKAITKAFKLLKEHDTLLILGKGHENEIIIKDKRIKHNDSQFVKDLIKQSKTSIK